ncbi:MAG: hypothetical protein A2V90_09570 [Gammaproteobacteria bacterium RBG_16_57_12]|nr:MAG: hypothetical protein A2V90_09570 [Gammaproteobacteria bacterium RBG_16_57_12]
MGVFVSQPPHWHSTILPHTAINKLLNFMVRLYNINWYQSIHLPIVGGRTGRSGSAPYYTAGTIAALIMYIINFPAMRWCVAIVHIV